MIDEARAIALIRDDPKFGAPPNPNTIRRIARRRRARRAILTGAALTIASLVPTVAFQALGGNGRGAVVEPSDMRSSNGVASPPLLGGPAPCTDVRIINKIRKVQGPAGNPMPLRLGISAPTGDFTVDHVSVVAALPGAGVGVDPKSDIPQQLRIPAGPFKDGATIPAVIQVSRPGAYSLVASARVRGPDRVCGLSGMSIAQRIGAIIVTP